MVVKVKKTGIPPMLLYSAAGVMVAAVTVIFAARSVLIPTQAPLCSTRYQAARTLPYTTRQGTPLTPIELQSRLLERDWGLGENGQIVKVASGPSPVALRVALPAGGVNGGNSENPVSGVGFKWTSSFFRSAAAACLTYSVKLPGDFAFAQGGVLPSLVGASQAAGERSGQADRFSARLKWSNGGKLEVHFGGPTTRRGVTVPSKDRWFELPRDRWVSIEQEVVLNTPGRANGVLRVWADGALLLERKGFTFRTKPSTGFSGVAADVHYAQRDTDDWAPAPKATAIDLSPMIVRYR